jgi:tetratricopeptide (TPR) repeat protein
VNKTVQALLYLFIDIIVIGVVTSSCVDKTKATTNEEALDLKRGATITCGPPSGEYGSLSFDVVADDQTRNDFNLGVKMLHSFEYDEAEKIFAGIIDRSPSFAMAYWGVAMCNFHPLWTPPTGAELAKGRKAVDLALSLKAGSEKEKGFIDAIAAFYHDADNADHKTRTKHFEEKMASLYQAYPSDKEVAIFYALSLDAAADPTDKTYQNQLKAGDILNSLYPGSKTHPGILHYLIHTYDYPGLATRGLLAARSYAAVAPSSAHALHMPSHIFTRLGLWDECIQSNLASKASAICYAESAGIKGHWDEELHALDYLVYAYLQKHDNAKAKAEMDYILSMHEINPANFKVAYAIAAIPCRYYLENRMWKEAARLDVKSVCFDWDKFPWQSAIVRYTRALGAANTGDLAKAKNEEQELHHLYDTLFAQKDDYKANQVLIQIKTVDGWIAFRSGKQDEGIALMTEATDLENKTEKHPVTPAEVQPARELLANMYLEAGKCKEALEQYELSLQRNPNRYNGLLGALSASEKLGLNDKVSMYRNSLQSLVKIKK